MTDPNEGSSFYEFDRAINDARLTLQRFNRDDEVLTLINEQIQLNPYRDLDADKDHNEDWLRVEYAKRFKSVMARLATKLTTMASSVSVKDRDDAQSVLGIRGLSGDPAALAISLRDAQERVETITDTRGLQRLLDRAVRIGDQTLSRAIVSRAIELGDADTVNAFSAAYPQLTDSVERLWDSRHPGPKAAAAGITFAGYLSNLRPAALAGLQWYELDRVAAGDTASGRWNVRA
ncbi:hypothetical protein [Mycolicibacterium baixiangningiae]|uniref:hypothetical protein n=1 Tax=Mycolicibacterium baixiangningiae TaxID=2761578 RepID=UPI0018696A69|nr:hypothetical protein [Mycolicibacterium baixiangningiae]